MNQTHAYILLIDEFLYPCNKRFKFISRYDYDLPVRSHWNVVLKPVATQTWVTIALHIELKTDVCNLNQKQIVSNNTPLNTWIESWGIWEYYAAVFQCNKYTIICVIKMYDDAMEVLCATRNKIIKVLIRVIKTLNAFIKLFFFFFQGDNIIHVRQEGKICSFFDP